MFATRYYRQYLWIFFYMFFILMAVALAFDSHSSINGSSSQSIKLPRFLNVLFCFMFSGLGVLMQHFFSRRVLGLRFLSNRRLWMSRKIKVKKRKCKKVFKKRNFILMCITHSIANLVVLIPFFTICILQIAGVWTSVQTSVFQKEFFCVAIFIKYGSWYLSILTSRFSLFFNKRRINNLI